MSTKFTNKNEQVIKVATTKQSKGTGKKVGAPLLIDQKKEEEKQ